LFTNQNDQSNDLCQSKKNHPNHNKHVQNDGMIFFTLVQIEYFLLGLWIKEVKNSTNEMSHAPIEIILLHS
jgi:hypothetical protein